MGRKRRLEGETKAQTQDDFRDDRHMTLLLWGIVKLSVWNGFCGTEEKSTNLKKSLYRNKGEVSTKKKRTCSVWPCVLFQLSFVCLL